MDSIDELLLQVLERPEEQWVLAVAELCANHNAQAAEIRRRFELLRSAGFLTVEPSSPPPPGFPERLGEYQLLERLGQGGMGVVYAARQERLARNVAIKLVRPEHLFFAGARERFLPFPGWTLPNVMGAGGLQAMVKSGLPVKDKRVVVAGTGPLLLAVAAYLKTHGADVRLVAEQTRLANAIWFGLSHPAKLPQAMALKLQLIGTLYETGCWVVRASGKERLEAVELRQGSDRWTEDCDYLACGFGLTPNVELPVVLGCGIRDGFVSEIRRRKLI